MLFGLHRRFAEGNDDAGLLPVHVCELLAGALAEGGESQVRIAIKVKAGGDEHAVNINAGHAREFCFQLGCAVGIEAAG